jgi:exonuclease III
MRTRKELNITKQQNYSNYYTPFSYNSEFTGINSLIKRHRLMSSIKKQDPTICCLQETYLTVLKKKKTHWLKEKGWKKIFQANAA